MKVNQMAIVKMGNLNCKSKFRIDAEISSAKWKMEVTSANFHL